MKIKLKHIILCLFTFVVTFSNKMIVNAANDTNCNGIFGGTFGDLLRQALRFMQWLAPVLVIALSIFEYVKAITSSDKDQMKKATGLMFKRLVLAFVIFFVTTLVNLFLGLLDIDTCDIG